MIHDETTQEIEIQSKKVVAFPKAAAAKRPSVMERIESSMSPWIKELDIEAPWIIRLIAVLGILILSMLIL